MMGAKLCKYAKGEFETHTLKGEFDGVFIVSKNSQTLVL